jgi:hypothetical protein
MDEWVNTLAFLQRVVGTFGYRMVFLKKTKKYCPKNAYTRDAVKWVIRDQ